MSDIFLPDAVARTIPAWSTALLAVAFGLHLRSWLRSRGGVRDEGVIELRPALPVPADQRWFWTDRWQAMEREVDVHVGAGRVVVLDGPDELFAHLDTAVGVTPPDDEPAVPAATDSRGAG